MQDGGPVVIVFWSYDLSGVNCRSTLDHVMNTSMSSLPPYVGIGVPMATVFRYVYVPEVTGVHCSTSWAASVIVLLIQSSRSASSSAPGWSFGSCKGYKSLGVLFRPHTSK